MYNEERQQRQLDMFLRKEHYCTHFSLFFFFYLNFIERAKRVLTFNSTICLFIYLCKHIYVGMIHDN